MKSAKEHASIVEAYLGEEVAAGNGHWTLRK